MMISSRTMGELIRFPEEKANKGNALTSSPAPPEEGSLERKIFHLFAASRDALKEEIFGKGLKGEKDLYKIEQFFLSILIQRFRNVQERFPSYMYLSQLLSRSAHLAPGYVVDLLKEKGYVFEVAQKAGDLCFILTSLFPEWLERRRSVTTREDYLRLGEFFYQEVAQAISGSRAHLFQDLSRHFRPYADAVKDAKGALFVKTNG